MLLTRDLECFQVLKYISIYSTAYILFYMVCAHTTFGESTGWSLRIHRTRAKGKLIIVYLGTNVPYLGSHVRYLGLHMCAMFSYSGDSAVSAPQQDIISWSYLNTDNILR